MHHEQLLLPTVGVVVVLAECVARQAAVCHPPEASLLLSHLLCLQAGLQPGRGAQQGALDATTGVAPPCCAAAVSRQLQPCCCCSACCDWSARCKINLSDL